jgi:hypothetical protein
MAISPACRRIVGVVATLAVIGVSLVAAGLVVAVSAGYAEDGQRVEFSTGGQSSPRLCRSRPNRPRITVWSGTRVTFINRLGQPAMLRIDGRDTALVGADEAAPMMFQRGPVSVSMALLCTSGGAEQFEAVTVTVAAPPAGSAGAAQDVPVPGGSARVGAARSGPGKSGAPTADPLTSPSVVVGPVLSARSRAVAAAGPRRPSGLLAVIAIVAVAGVTIAAIRTILTTRTTWAVNSPGR